MKFGWTIGIVVFVLLAAIAVLFYFFVYKKTAVASTSTSTNTNTVTNTATPGTVAAKPNPPAPAPVVQPGANPGAVYYSDKSYTVGSTYFNPGGSVIGYVSQGYIYLQEGTPVGATTAGADGMPDNTGFDITQYMM